MHANHSNGQSLNSTSKFMIGLACGTVIGAAVGVLLATKSGAELRGQIADSARRFGQRMSETYGTVNEAVASAAHTGQEAARTARDKFASARDRFATADEGRMSDMDRHDV
jgi:gas vesicle protein